MSFYFNKKFFEKVKHWKSFESFYFRHEFNIDDFAKRNWESFYSVNSNIEEFEISQFERNWESFYSVNYNIGEFDMGLWKETDAFQNNVLRINISNILK